VIPNAELYEVPFSLRSVIDETMEILAVKAKEKDVDLHVHYSTKAAHHYIGDAARYMPPSPVCARASDSLHANALTLTHAW
jgi:signal transduction histidine kinase